MASIICWLNRNEGALSVVLSIFSLIAAIGIPALIAYRQNKIALYEKRLEYYQKLQALKRFAEFCNKWETFNKTDSVDPIYQCQQGYLNAHYSVLDKDYLQNWQWLRENYVALALEKDQDLFSSLVYLQLFKNLKQAIKCFDALKSLMLNKYLSFAITLPLSSTNEYNSSSADLALVSS